MKVLVLFLFIGLIFCLTPQKLDRSELGDEALFGESVAISGNFAVVSNCKSSDNQGNVFIYKKDLSTGSWIFSYSITSTEEGFGTSVAIFGDNIIVGAPSENTVGSAHIYTRSGNTWPLSDSFYGIEIGQEFGFDVAISSDFAFVGSPKKSQNSNLEAGETTILERSGSSWSFKENLISSSVVASEHFGKSVAIYESYGVVGAYFSGISENGKAYIFKFSGNSWINTTTLEGDGNWNEDFGESVDLYDDICVVGGPGGFLYPGYAFIFQREAGKETWKKVKSLKESGDHKYYGKSVAVYKDMILVGQTKKVYVYKRISGFWVEAGNYKVEEDITKNYFGNSVALNGDHIIIGSRWHDYQVKDGVNSGAAYIYTYCGESLPCKNDGEPNYQCTQCSNCNFNCENGGSTDNLCEYCECLNQWSVQSKCAICSIDCPNGANTNEDCSGCLDIYDCFGYSSEDSKACNNGTCVGYNKCNCPINMDDGKNCSFWACVDHEITDTYYWKLVDGVCVKVCYSGLLGVGGSCIQPGIIIGVIAGISGGACVIILIFILLLIILFVLFKKATKYNHIENVDMILKEAELEQKSSMRGHAKTGTKVKIDHTSYIIDPLEIDLKDVIGSGGSDTTIYLAEWKGQKCAYKGYRIHNSLFTDNESFEEFEKEVAVCANVNHPSILQFFGACVNPPKIGLLIEFCENGDIPRFISKYITRNKKNYPISEKFRLIKEIVSGMEYLHSRNFIHRDLKPENVLIDNKDHAKIMDFGLSKLKENEGQTMTKQVGTGYYMSPEVILNSNYSYPCDVYSFAMLAYSLVHENFGNPFGKGNQNTVMHNVARNPNFKPKIDESYFEGNKFLIEIIKRNWNHDPDKRDTFRGIRTILNNKKCVIQKRLRPMSTRARNIPKKLKNYNKRTESARGSPKIPKNRNSKNIQNKNKRKFYPNEIEKKRTSTNNNNRGRGRSRGMRGRGRGMKGMNRRSFVEKRSPPPSIPKRPNSTRFGIQGSKQTRGKPARGKPHIPRKKPSPPSRPSFNGNSFENRY